MALTVEKIKRILIPVDGSNYSIRAAQLGIGLAKVLGAEIHVMYIIDSVILGEISNVIEKSVIEKELKEDGERYVNYVRQLAEQEGLQVNSVIVKGQPHDQIVTLAKSQGINLIVMGTRGQRGTERILIGSVAERVIEYAPCPVLVTR